MSDDRSLTDIFALFNPSPPPPDSIPLRILGLSALPADRETVRAVFRARVKLVHPDVAAYTAMPAEITAAVQAMAEADPNVQELKWARDVLLAKIPEQRDGYDGSSVSDEQPSRKYLCKGGCGNELRHYHANGRYQGYCWTCARTAENARQRELRRAARADRTCAGCGRQFTPPRSDGTYCAAKCRQRAYRQRRAVTAARVAPMSASQPSQVLAPQDADPQLALFGGER